MVESEGGLAPHPRPVQLTLQFAGCRGNVVAATAQLDRRARDERIGRYHGRWTIVRGAPEIAEVNERHTVEGEMRKDEAVEER